MFDLQKMSNNASLNQFLINHYPACQQIYTDGSKNREGRTAYGIDSSKGISYIGRLPNYASIYDAELFAIHITIQLIENSNFKKNYNIGLQKCITEDYRHQAKQNRFVGTRNKKKHYQL